MGGTNRNKQVQPEGKLCNKENQGKREGEKKQMRQRGKKVVLAGNETAWDRGKERRGKSWKDNNGEVVQRGRGTGTLGETRCSSQTGVHENSRGR